MSEDALCERATLDPGGICPECGGELRLLGEDMSEILEFVAAKLKVVETLRLKKSCRACEKIIQPAAPTRPIPRGMAGPGLLAHILVAKFDHHLPLYRQGEIFAPPGADIPRSTLIDWCGQATRVLRPLAERIKVSVFSATRLHADDTPIRVLDPKVKVAGKARGVKEGRIWTYVRDDRPWAGDDPPAVAYFFAPDKQGEHPQRHLKDFRGILQADAYRGFEKLYEPGADGAQRVREAACWAHLRRAFHDVWKSTGSEIAKDALDQIGKLYDIERAINGQPADRRSEIRQEKSRPIVKAFRVWLHAQLVRIPGKGDLAKAMQYALNRWPSFALFLDDGRVAMDNNAAERAIKPVVIGRKNWMFAGSDSGGEILADAMTVIETAKMSGLNPEPTSRTSSPGSTTTSTRISTTCRHGTGLKNKRRKSRPPKPAHYSYLENLRFDFWPHAACFWDVILASTALGVRLPGDGCGRLWLSSSFHVVISDRASARDENRVSLRHSFGARQGIAKRCPERG